MPASPFDSPYRLSVEIAWAYHQCEGHGPHRCFAIICPGEVAYVRARPTDHHVAILCGACGQLAINGLQRHTREALLTMHAHADGKAPPACSCPPATVLKGHAGVVAGVYDPACPLHGSAALASPPTTPLRTCGYCDEGRSADPACPEHGVQRL